jgi:hypothetical protein
LARSKKQREQHRTSVTGSGADGAVEIIIPIESFEAAEAGRDAPWADVARRFGSVRCYPAALDAAPSSIALVLDDFAFDLHVDDRFVATGTHDGVTFREIAVEHGASVYLARNVDVRRSTPADLDAASAKGHLVGSRVAAFGVDTLELR